MSQLELLPWDIWCEGLLSFLDFRQTVKLQGLSMAIRKIVRDQILVPSVATSPSYQPTFAIDLDISESTSDSSSTVDPSTGSGVGSSPSTSRRRLVRYAFKIVREKSYYQFPPPLHRQPAQHITFTGEWRRISSPAIWDQIFESLNNVETLSLETDFFACPCRHCGEYRQGEMVREGSHEDEPSDKSPGRLLATARRHAFDRFAMALQVAIRNRRTLRVLNVGYLPTALSFGLSEDSLVPELPIDFHDAAGKRLRFDKLESVSFSRTIDCRHVVPLLDFCEFANLTVLSIGALKASYAYLKPQFGLQPTIVFAPQQIVQNCHSLEATPHLPAVYNGAVDENLQFHGQGLYCCNLYSYEGEFEFGFNNGFGRMRANTGETYQGQWRQGRRCGQGVVVQADGTRMSGHWLNDLLEGHAALERRDGLMYEGGWYQSLWDGWGVVSIHGKLVGVAQFQHGLLHGWAKLLRLPENQIPVWEERWFRKGRAIIDQKERNNLLVTTHTPKGTQMAWIEDPDGNILQKCKVASTSRNSRVEEANESPGKSLENDTLGQTSSDGRLRPAVMLPSRLTAVSPKSAGSPGRREISSPTNLNPPSPVSSTSIPQPPDEPRLFRQNAVEWDRLDAPSNEDEDSDATSSSSSTESLSSFSDGVEQFSSTSALSFFAKQYATHPNSKPLTTVATTVNEDGVPTVSSLGYLSKVKRPTPNDIPEWMLRRLKTSFGFEENLAFPPFPNHLVLKK